MNFGSSYPVDLDNLKRGEVGFKIGISPTYKPSKAAVAAAFRSHSSNTYTSECPCLISRGRANDFVSLQRATFKRFLFPLLSTPSSWTNSKKSSSLDDATTRLDGPLLNFTVSFPGNHLCKLTSENRKSLTKKRRILESRRR